MQYGRAEALPMDIPYHTDTMEALSTSDWPDMEAKVVLTGDFR